LWGLGIPVILFVVALLVVNFFYVGYQLRELTHSYVGSIARAADNEFALRVNKIEELARVVAIYLQQNDSLDRRGVQKLLSRLLDADEKYTIFIAQKPWLLEGLIQGDDLSQLRQRHFDSRSEAAYQNALKLARQHNGWGRIRYEGGDWKARYSIAFESAQQKTEGVVVVDVRLYELVKNFVAIEESEEVKILLSVHRDSAAPKTLLLATDSPNRLKPVALDLSDIPQLGQSLAGLSAVFQPPPPTDWAAMLVAAKERLFVSHLPASCGPEVQLVALLPHAKILRYIYRAKLVESLTVFVALLGLVVLTLLVSRSVSTPISALTKKVEVLAAGNLNVTFPKTDSCIELHSLAENLNRTVKRLRDYFADLKQATAQNEKINSEISISHNVQMSLLPHPAAHPQSGALDIHGCTLPAKEVGGDFYYFFEIDSQRVALVIGDVSGKGMPAAIMMAVCLSLFRAQSANTPEPSVCLEKINQFLIQEDTSSGAFVTLFYAIVDVSSGVLSYANAGHNPPLVARKNGRVEFLDQQHGLALAVGEQARYQTHQNRLNPGDMLLLYTDGITEAYNRQEEEFGEQRLTECLTASHRATRHRTADTLSARPKSAKGYVQGVIRQVAQFIRGRIQFDDMTLLCAVMQETQTGMATATSVARPPAITALDTALNKDELRALEFPSAIVHHINIGYDILEINKALAAVESFCGDYQIDGEIVADLCVAVDEFLSNIIRHNLSRGDDTISVRLAKKESALVVVLEYSGPIFNPLEVPPYDTRKDWRQRRLGGLGIYIGQQLADHIGYAHAAGRNTLTIEKKLRDGLCADRYEQPTVRNQL